MSNTLVSDFRHQDRTPTSPDVGESEIRRFRTPIVNAVSAGEGAPVVISHGLAASLHDWDEFLPALAMQGYAGYALDLLGHGESAKPGELSAYTAENVFAHIDAWIESLKIETPFVFVGHSLGGYMGLTYALRYPGRLKALVLVNPFYSISQLPTAMRLFFKQKLVNTNLIQVTPYWLFRILIDLSSLSFGGAPGKYTLPEAVRIQTALDYKRASANIFNIPRTIHSGTPDLSALNLPVLVVYGNRDQTLAPESFPVLVDHLPNGRGISLPAGHVPHQSHARQFNRIVLEFLKEVG